MNEAMILEQMEGKVETPVETPIEQVIEEIVEEVVVEKPYTFRKLSSPDMFLMFKIISAIGINEFTACFGKESVLKTVKNLMTGMMNGETEQNENGDGETEILLLSATSVALEVVNVILGNIGRCEKEIYQLLSQTSNLSIEEITAEGNAVMFFEMLIDFCKKDEFPDFIKVVSGLFK